MLGCDRGSMALANAAEWLRRPSPETPFDVVFLDPPFRQGLLADCCDLLESGGWLAPGAYVYIEADHDEPLPPVPANWSLYRDKTAGQVAYRLWLRE